LSFKKKQGFLKQDSLGLYLKKNLKSSQYENSVLRQFMDRHDLQEVDDVEKNGFCQACAGKPNNFYYQE